MLISQVAEMSLHFVKNGDQVAFRMWKGAAVLNVTDYVILQYGTALGFYFLSIVGTGYHLIPLGSCGW